MGIIDDDLPPAAKARFTEIEALRRELHWHLAMAAYHALNSMDRTAFSEMRKADAVRIKIEAWHAGAG